MARTDRLRGDDGAVLVETALVFPILFFFVMVLIEFSWLELRQSQATSAARDGARVAITQTSWTNADVNTYNSTSGCPPSPSNYNAICSAVVQRLAGTKIDTVNVTCQNRYSTTITCANLVEGSDSVVVTVGYTFTPMTFIGQTFLGTTRTYTTTAEMYVQ